MLKKTDNIFKWIILGIAVLHIITYFMPVCESVYKSSYSDPETNLIYLYGSGSSYIIVGFTSLLIPIAGLIFLFANFKNSKIFFFGFSATYIINCIFTILNLSEAVSNNGSNYYEYSFKYGYYFYIGTIVLLSGAIISAFVIYLILKYQDIKSNSENKQQSSLDVLRSRIEFLDDLKMQGILTEIEYEQKRADIIKELKI